MVHKNEPSHGVAFQSRQYGSQRWWELEVDLGRLEGLTSSQMRIFYSHSSMNQHPLTSHLCSPIEGYESSSLISVDDPPLKVERSSRSYGEVERT